MTVSTRQRPPAAPLRIGVDTLFVRPGVNGGGEFYLRNLLAALARVDGVNEYVVFVSPRNRHLFEGLGANFRTVVCRYPGGSAEVYARIAWEWSVLRLQALRHRLDAMHFAANLVPYRFPVPTVLTLYDFSAAYYLERFPDVAMRRVRGIRAREHVRSCGRATRVTAISEFTRQEAMRRAGVAPDRITTILLAGREFDVPTRENARSVVVRYGVDRPYVLSVATLSAHKNVVRLLEAFARVSDGALRGYRLVLVGKAGTAITDLKARIGTLGLEGRVVLPGYVPDGDVPAFYRAAEVFAFPSLYEGFGLPVLEAALCGTPIVASHAASIPEVGGDAPRYMDPERVDDIAAALAEVAGSEALRAEMAERGHRRARAFSWDRTARQMVAAYRDVALRRGTGTASARAHAAAAEVRCG